MSYHTKIKILSCEHPKIAAMSFSCYEKKVQDKLYIQGDKLAKWGMIEHLFFFFQFFTMSQHKYES